MPLPINKTLKPRIQPNQWAQNRKPVVHGIEELMRHAANQLLAYRGKELFCTPGSTTILTMGSGLRDRWRFYSHLGPYTTRVNVSMRMALQDSGFGLGGTPYGKFTLYDSSNTVLGTLQFAYGRASSTDDDPDTLSGDFEGYIDVSGNQDVHGLFQDNDGRIVSATVWETNPAFETENGYLDSIASGAPIYDTHRAQLVSIANAMWTRGGAQVLNFALDTAPLSRTLTTDINIVDNSSTTVSVNSPGFTVDMTGKELSRQTTGVPCKIAVYASGTLGPHGSVKLKDSAGTALATVGPFEALGWYLADVTLPASSAKYDLTLASDAVGGGGTVTLYAVSVYEYMT